MKEERYIELMHELIEGAIAPDELAELQRELKQNPQARKHYIEIAELHSLLIEVPQFQGRHNHAVKEIVSMERVLLRQKIRTMKTVAWGAAAAIALIVLSLSTIFIERSVEITFKKTPGTKYSLTHAEQENTERTESAHILKIGSRLQLHQGSVELTFQSGVTSIVKAPADLTLLDTDHLLLSLGQASFEVPEEAVGFRVDTPQIRVVDLGTQFGIISSDDEQDQVHVFQGKVEVTVLDDKREDLEERQLLYANEACQVSSQNKLLSIAPRKHAFVDELPSSLEYLYWSFDEVEDNGFPASGVHADLNRTKAAPAREVDAREMQVKGKYGKAVAFTINRQHILHTQHPGFDVKTPFTFSYWVKIPDEEALALQLNHVRWAKLSHTSRLARWELRSVSGDRKAWRHKVSNAGHIVARPDLADGTWHHVTTVFTGGIAANNVPETLIYIDGILRTVMDTKVDDPYEFTTENGFAKPMPITIGGVSTSYRGAEVADLKYYMDELYLIHGALSERQINNLMRGSPSFLRTKQ